MTSRGCVICGKPVFASYWVCKTCYFKFRLAGKKHRQWPKWVKALVIIEQRAERHDKLVTVPLLEE